MFLEMRFDLGTLDSGERSLPFGLLVVCNIGSAILHFRMLHMDKKYLIFVCNKCSNITHLLHHKNF